MCAARTNRANTASWRSSSRRNAITASANAASDIAEGSTSASASTTARNQARGDASTGGAAIATRPPSDTSRTEAVTSSPHRGIGWSRYCRRTYVRLSIPRGLGAEGLHHDAGVVVLAPADHEPVVVEREDRDVAVPVGPA